MSGWYLELSRLADIFALQAVLLRRGGSVAGLPWGGRGGRHVLYAGDISVRGERIVVTFRSVIVSSLLCRGMAAKAAGVQERLPNCCLTSK